MLWAEPVHVHFAPDARAARRWAALVFGTDLLGELSEPEMMALARHGGAVSPVTSYLAIEPGVRPSTEGLDWEGGGGRGEGIGLGGLVTRSHVVHTPLSPAERQKHLEHLVAESLSRCGGGGRSVSVDIETTLREIVDIPRFELAASTAGCGTSASVCDATLTRCLREAIWSFALPRGFTSESERFTLRT